VIIDRFASSGEEDRVRLLLGLAPDAGIPFNEIRALVLAGLADESWRVRKAAKEALEKHPISLFLDDLLGSLDEIGRPGLRNASVEILTAHLAEALPPIRDQFSGSDVEVRKFMVDIVGGSRGVEGLDFLVLALHDPDPNVASAAAEFLGYHEDPRAVTALMGAIESSGGWIAYPAIESLGKIGGGDALPILTRLAKDGALREAAVEAIGSIGGDGSVPVLVDAFLTGHRRLKETAVRGLGRILTGSSRSAATPQGIESLIDTMAAPLLAQESLFLDLLVHPDAAIAAGAETLLLAAGNKDAFLRVIRGLQAEEADRIVSLLGRLPVDLTPRLAGELENEDPLVRFICLRALLARGEFPPGIGPVLLHLLADPQGHIRGDAALALGQAGHGEGWWGILDLLKDPYPDVREKAAAALHLIGASRTDLAETIVGSVLDEMAAGRLSPVAGIGIAAHLLPGDSRISKAAVDLLSDSDPANRKAALAALPLTPRGCADDDLYFQMMADEEPSVRLAALRGCLLRGKAPDFTRLLLIVLDPSLEVASEAARFLGEKAPGEVVEKLWATVGGRPGLVKLRAVEGLAANPGFRRTGFFRELLGGDDPEIVRISLRALVSLGGKEELPTVLMAMEHADWRVRLEAVSLVAGIGGRMIEPLLMERRRKETDPTVAEKITRILAGY
jgi:HEAT repeat protein